VSGTVYAVIEDSISTVARITLQNMDESILSELLVQRKSQMVGLEKANKGLQSGGITALASGMCVPLDADRDC
jgi:hypothetical protein